MQSDAITLISLIMIDIIFGDFNLPSPRWNAISGAQG